MQHTITPPPPPQMLKDTLFCRRGAKIHFCRRGAKILFIICYLDEAHIERESQIFYLHVSWSSLDLHCTMQHVCGNNKMLIYDVDHWPKKLEFKCLLILLALGILSIWDNSFLHVAIVGRKVWIMIHHKLDLSRIILHVLMVETELRVQERKRFAFNRLWLLRTIEIPLLALISLKRM